MKRKKNVALLSAALALVLAVQGSALLFYNNRGNTNAGSEQAAAHAALDVMDAKPDISIAVIKAAKTAGGGQGDSALSLSPVNESPTPQDVEEIPENVKVLSKDETDELIEIAQKKIAESGVELEEGDIVVIPQEELPEELRVKDLGLGIAYDPVSGLLYGVDGHGLLYIGFDYDSAQGIFFTPKYPWQRNFGFCELYDVCAPVTMMFYDTQRFKFDYDGKNWMIQVWKGQYGITSGAEVGIYTKSPDRTVEFYSCASDEDCLAMSFELYKNGEIFFTRESQSHWWLTGFAPLTATAAEDFELRTKIETKDEEMAAAFAAALEENGYVLGETYRVDGAIVYFNW